MITTIWRRLKSEYASYGTAEKLFILCMMVCSFTITGEAAITRATANSVFITAYTVKFLPVAWMASVPLNMVIVTFYNSFIARLGCMGMMTLSTLVALCINVISAFFVGEVHYLPFMLYLWKDIFIILMFQHLWSIIHATIRIDRAQYLYGIFFGMGGLGSVTGSLVPAFFATIVGSEKLLLFTLPFYVVTWCFYKGSLRFRERIEAKQDITAINRSNRDIAGGLQLIRKSRFLVFILLLVICMQVTATLLDFQFNSILETTIVVQDLRTRFLGRFFGVVNTINLFLQFIGSFVLVRVLGLHTSHILVPLVLGVHAIRCLLWPSFSALSLSFGTNKALDYSIFGIIKEMLYIPLKVEDKFRAKAIIDVFAYRTSKACASLIILGLSLIAGNSMQSILTFGVLSIYLIWLILVVSCFSFYDDAVEKQHIYWP